MDYTILYCKNNHKNIISIKICDICYKHINIKLINCFYCFNKYNQHNITYYCQNLNEYIQMEHKCNNYIIKLNIPYFITKREIEYIIHVDSINNFICENSNLNIIINILQKNKYMSKWLKKTLSNNVPLFAILNLYMSINFYKYKKIPKHSSRRELCKPGNDDSLFHDEEANHHFQPGKKTNCSYMDVLLNNNSSKKLYFPDEIVEIIFDYLYDAKIDNYEDTNIVNIFIFDLKINPDIYKIKKLNIREHNDNIYRYYLERAYRREIFYKKNLTNLLDETLYYNNFTINYYENKYDEEYGCEYEYDDDYNNECDNRKLY